MQFIGDLGRAFFGALYDWRLAVLAGSVVVGVAVLGLAVRRGWLSAARRHRGRTGAIVAVALAIGLPLTWYLASPIFLRTSLVEAEDAVPVVVPAASPDRAAAPTSTPTPSATAGPSEAPTATPTPAPAATPTPAPTVFQPAVVATGSFHGSDDFHFGEGTATIVETAPGRYRLRFADFSVRNGPDLYVYLSPSADGYADGSLELGRLKATDGAFGYDLPAGTDPADFASAVVWCKQFSHLFATAPLADA
jgi:hypothetical protein